MCPCCEASCHQHPPPGQRLWRCPLRTQPVLRASSAEPTIASRQRQHCPNGSEPQTTLRATTSGGPLDGWPPSPSRHSGRATRDKPGSFSLLYGVSRHPRAPTAATCSGRPVPAHSVSPTAVTSRCPGCSLRTGLQRGWQRTRTPPAAARPCGEGTRPKRGPSMGSGAFWRAGANVGSTGTGAAAFPAPSYGSGQRQTRE